MKLRWLPYWAAFGAALALRLLLLDQRPLHHDEGMAAWILSRLLEGYQLAYDPERFHGPFLLAFAAPFVALLGENVLALRLPAALASAAMVPLLLPLRRRLGVAGVTGAAWLLALSPAFVAYGRTLVPETFLVFFTLALVVAAVDWLDSRRPRSLVLAALALGLLATVKETYVLTLAGLALGAGAAWAWGHDPVSRPREIGIVSPSAPRPALRDLWAAVPARTARHALLAFAAPYVLLYTSFFTHPRGLPDSLATFLVWAGKGLAGAGHAKPWDYFLRLLLGCEPLIICCALAGGWLALRRRDAFGAFCTVWAAAELLAYSLLRYKTPWLVLNVLLPAVLVAGVLCREIASSRMRWLNRAALAAILALALGWSAWRAVELAFLRYDDPRLPLVYAPTHRSYEALVAHVRAVTRPGPGRRAPVVRIFGRHAWPLPWDLRDLPAVDYRHEIPARPDGDVLVVEGKLEERLRPLLHRHYRRHQFLLRPGAPLVVYVDVSPTCRPCAAARRRSPW